MKIHLLLLCTLFSGTLAGCGGYFAPTPEMQESWDKTWEDVRSFSGEASFKEAFDVRHMDIRYADPWGNWPDPDPIDPRGEPCTVIDVEHRYVEVNGVGGVVPYSVCQNGGTSGNVGQRVTGKPHFPREAFSE